MSKRDNTRAEAQKAREFVLARLAEARAAMACALEEVDSALVHFLAPDDDKTGDQREEAIHTADELLGDAAQLLQAAQTALPGIDPGEGAPEYADEEDGDDEGADEED